MPRLVLFLDIEGCCHPADAASALPSRCVVGEDLFRWVQPLLDLLDELPELEVVVHSAWHHVYQDLPSLMADLPPALAARVVGTTPLEIADRQSSIEAYVERHGIEHFVAVDDTPMQFNEGLPWLVVAGPGGLSDSKTVQALRDALKG